MKCQINFGIVTIFICATLTRINANETVEPLNISQIHPGFQELHPRVVMVLQTAINGCSATMDAIDNADEKRSEFLQCFGATNKIADKYNFSTVNELEKQSFTLSPEYPIYLCELYKMAQDCLPGMLPYLGFCLSFTDAAVAKLFTSYKHVVELACENNATLFSELYPYRFDRCVDNILKHAAQTFIDIIRLDEDVLFSTPKSCRILSTAQQNVRNQIDDYNCNDSLRQIFRNGFKRIWEISGCGN